MEHESADESIDSIPRPEYEIIDGSSGKTTPSTTTMTTTASTTTSIQEPRTVKVVIEQLKEKVVNKMEGPEDLEKTIVEAEDDEDDASEEAEEEFSNAKTDDSCYLTAAEQQILVTTQNDDAVKEEEECENDGEEEQSFHEGLNNHMVTPIKITLTSSAGVSIPKLDKMDNKKNKLIITQLVASVAGKKHVTPPAQIAIAGAVTTNPTKISPGTVANEDKTSPLNNVRSSTPLSREFLALQKSVNNSKILTEFVTDTSVMKARKLRKTGAANKDTSLELTSTSSREVGERRKSTAGCMQHSTAENIIAAAVQSFEVAIPLTSPAGTGVGGSAEKIRKSASKFVPLKDEPDSVNMKPSRRSRSKSVHRKSPVVHLDLSQVKLRKWPSEEKISKRTNMRSQNSEFVQKQMEFLNRVNHQQRDEPDGSDIDDTEYALLDTGEDGDIGTVGSGVSALNDNNSNMRSSELGNFRRHLTLSSSSIANDSGGGSGGVIGLDDTVDSDSLDARLKSFWQSSPQPGWDSFCWKCRYCGDLFPCSKCLRCFHATCIKINSTTKLDNTWTCPECTAIENVLNGPKKTRRNDLSVDLLSQLLSFALKRMKNVKGYSKFLYHGDELLQYSKYIVNPVTFQILQEKIEKRIFRCAEEFVNETKWILHNALILTSGTPNSKEVLTAKSVLKICRQEANEIDTCAECYLNANTRADWFVDVCTQPHLLLWAKLKGFPYWPAKAMGPVQGSHVNVRFFGEHDRAFVPVKDCFLYSEQDPNTQTGKRSARELADCIKEVEVHIKKIKAKIGDFQYATYKTLFDPNEEMQQLEEMMPGAQEYIKRQQTMVPKPSLQFKIVKTSDNHLSMIKKASTTESGNDSDHSNSAGSKKMKKSKSETNATPSDPLNTTKYEVISQSSSDDGTNPSPKLSTVIKLKRKSNSSAHGSGGVGVGGNSKQGDKDGVDLPLPKLTKIEDCKGDEEKGGEVKVVSGKRKLGAADIECNDDGAGCNVEGDKHRSKHAKHEPRIPMLTIKNFGTKAVESKLTKDKTHTPTTAAIATTIPATTTPATQETAAAQSVMENLVKNKQGVTIKKISKESSSGKMSAPAAIVAAVSLEMDESRKVVDEVGKGSKAAAAQEKPSNKNKENSIESKEKAPAKLNILTDLVPFVEIKQEITSDEEVTHAEAAQQQEESTKAKPKTAVVATKENANTTNAKATVPLPAPSQIPIAQDSLRLLPIVKQEVMSEDEDASQVKENTKAMNNTQNASASNAMQSAVATSVPAEAVRVVGDTTIQRITTKNSINSNQSVNNSQPQNSIQINISTGSGTVVVAGGGGGAAAAATTSGGAQLTTSSGKRSSIRGVPYGPLPASATAAAIKSNTSSGCFSSNSNVNMNAQNMNTLTSQQHQQLRQTQRARKSFPNQTPPPPQQQSVGPTRGSIHMGILSPVSNAVAAATTTTASNPHDAMKQQRAVLKTNMVSIPVDVANNRSMSNNNSIIPVPPLTAVSKSTPQSSTMTTAAPAVGGVANATAAVTSVCSGTTSITLTTAGAAAFANCNGAAAKSAPPPLAELSQTTTTTNAVLISSTCATLTSTSGTFTVSCGTVPVVNDIMTTTAPVAATNTSSSSTSVASITAAAPVPVSTAVVSANADAHLLGDYVTPSFASAITEAICRGPPKMISRPTGPLQSDGSAMYPSHAGPVSRTLVENAHKLTDFFISVMEDTMSEMSTGEDSVPQAKVTLLNMEMERMKQSYEFEIAELKRTSDLMLCEMRKSMENEKTRLVNEIRKQCEMERLRSVEETKKKQWCANCGREAQFYCCWNTSYCDYPCQQLHWSRHAANCAQPRTVGGSASDAGATMVMVSSANGSSSQQERQLAISKPTTLIASNKITATAAATASATPAHYNKTVISTKKDKNTTKNNSNINSCVATTTTTMTTPSAAEVLKLPSNTYLRAVPIGASNQTNSNNSSNSNVRAAPYPLPLQHINIPLPITASVNSGPPYTIVQRGTSWELMSTSAPAQAQQSVNTSTTIATVPQQQQQQQQTRHVYASGGQISATNKSGAAGGGGSRNRGVANAASMQQHNLLRPTQM